MMQEEETIDLLRHYRHDWMNQVQLLMGYASMGKLDKVQDKLKESISMMDQERKLTDLGIPKTAIWIVAFNWSYDNFRIDYQVDGDNKNLSDYDEKIHNQLNAIMNSLCANCDENELYHGTVILKLEEKSEVNAVIEIEFSGAFRQINKIKNQILAIEGLEEVNFSSIADDKQLCKLTWICN